MKRTLVLLSPKRPVKRKSIHLTQMKEEVEEMRMSGEQESRRRRSYYLVIQDPAVSTLKPLKQTHRFLREERKQQHSSSTTSQFYWLIKTVYAIYMLCYPVSSHLLFLYTLLNLCCCGLITWTNLLTLCGATSAFLSHIYHHTYLFSPVRSGLEWLGSLTCL